MRFQVPQFIEIEDKIFGPLTFKQFIYLTGSIGFCVMLFATSGIFLMALLGLPLLGLGMALAFYRINNRPFVEMLQSALTFYIGGKLYLWKKGAPKKSGAPAAAATDAAAEKIYVPKLTESKLRDIAWSLDIKESMYSETDEARAMRKPKAPERS